MGPGVRALAPPSGFHGRMRMAKHVFITGGVVSSLGKGITGASLGRLLKSRGPARRHPEVRPLPERRPRHHEPLPARRGVRHRRRRRDRPGPGALRALRRREPLPRLQHHLGLGLLQRHPQGAAGRLPGRHRPGDPAHHQRDQGADSRAWPATPRSTWSSPRSAARWATSRACPSSRPSASSATTSAARTCSTST